MPPNITTFIICVLFLLGFLLLSHPEKISLRFKRESTLSYNDSEKTAAKPFKVSLQNYLNLRSGKSYLESRCSSCALVSSSGQLLNSSAGKEIDQHECVIRMNLSPTKGYEQDVGNKTTIRFLSFGASQYVKGKVKESFFKKDETLRTVVVWATDDANAQKYLARFMRNAVSDEKLGHLNFFNLTSDQFAAEDAEFNEKSGKSREATKTLLTTGWFTISFLRKICQRIDIYGMVPESHCRSAKGKKSGLPYHFWEKRPSECAQYLSFERKPFKDRFSTNDSLITQKAGHRFIHEKSIFKLWAKNGIPDIQFFHPAWDMS